MSQSDLLRDAVAMLDQADIPYMIVGSYASVFHGEPRMTRDIDVVVDPSKESLRVLVGLIDRDRFYVGDALQAFVNRDMFNLIEPRSGWKVDFVIRKDRPFSEVEFERRIPATIADVAVYVATAEDTVLAKLEWAAKSGSDRQVDDVIAIAVSQRLDRTYLSEWAAELGVSDALGKALSAADEIRGQSPNS